MAKTKVKISKSISIISSSLVLVFLFIGGYAYIFAQETKEAVTLNQQAAVTTNQVEGEVLQTEPVTSGGSEIKTETTATKTEIEIVPAASEEPQLQEDTTLEAQPAAEATTAAGNVTLDFKEADIRNVLRIISYKGRVNIVPTPEVAGLISIRLVDVPWEKALDIILKTYGYAYERRENVIMVAPLEKLTAQKKQEVELAQVQPTLTEVFHLKFLDAQDAKKALEPQLSPRGRITVLEMRGQAGWEFGASELGKRQRKGEEVIGRSKILIVSDIPPVIEKVHEVIAKIDVMPQQVIIEIKILEVSRDRLKDTGVDWGTGASGAESATVTGTPLSKSSGTDNATLGGHVIGSEVASSVFGPKAGLIGTEPYNAGLELVFKKLTGTQFEVIIHALEEDVHTNTLSAPRILTLNNQEATILVGTKYPILTTETSTQSQYTVSQTLSYYQDIGIQLNIVPQIGADDYINLVLHPAVTSYTTTVGTNLYPIINTRELETRILMKSGETIGIGGLLKDVKSKSKIGVPVLSKIPILGVLFSRDTEDTEKIDLLIFVTARVLKEGELTPQELEKIEKDLEKSRAQKPAEEQMAAETKEAKEAASAAEVSPSQEVASWKQVNEGNQAKLASLTEQNSALTNAIEELKTKMAATTEIPGQLPPTEMSTELAALKEINAENQTKLASLEEQNSALTNAIEELKTKMAATTEIPGQLPPTEMSTELAALKEINAENQTKLASLEEQNTALNSALEELKAKIATTVQAAPQYTGEMGKELTELRTRLAQLERRDVVAESVARCKDNGSLAYAKGCQYAQTGMYQEAIKEFNKSLEIKPDDADTYYNLGYLFAQISQFDKSLECYQKALEINPQDLQAVYNLSIIYGHIGNTDKAKEYYQRYLQQLQSKQSN